MPQAVGPSRFGEPGQAQWWWWWWCRRRWWRSWSKMYMRTEDETESYQRRSNCGRHQHVRFCNGQATGEAEDRPTNTALAFDGYRSRQLQRQRWQQRRWRRCWCWWWRHRCHANTENGNFRSVGQAVESRCFTTGRLFGAVAHGTHDYGHAFESVSFVAFYQIAAGWR